MRQLRSREQLQHVSSTITEWETFHEILGAYSLRDEGGRVAAHDTEHFAQIRALLAR